VLRNASSPLVDAVAETLARFAARFDAEALASPDDVGRQGGYRKLGLSEGGYRKLGLILARRAIGRSFAEGDAGRNGAATAGGLGFLTALAAHDSRTSGTQRKRQMRPDEALDPYAEIFLKLLSWSFLDISTLWTVPWVLWNLRGSCVVRLASRIRLGS
jgi:hypothetical protein